MSLQSSNQGIFYESHYYVVIPDDPNAKLMYYCYCVDCLLNVSAHIPKLSRIINYNKYNLNYEEKTDLLKFCGILSPEVLNDKCIFKHEALCMSYPNNFYHVSDVKNILHPPQFIDIMNFHVDLVNIMTYKSSWIVYYYYEPYELLLQSLKQSSSTHHINNHHLTQVERISQIEADTNPIEKKSSSKCNSIDETEIQIHSTTSQQSEIIESNIINSNLNDMSPSLKINIRNLSQPRKKKRRSRKYSSGNCYENTSKEYLYNDDSEEVYEYIRNKQAHWLCFLANRRCIRIYMCSVSFLMIVLNIGCIISLTVNKIKAVGIVAIVFFCIGAIMELADLIRFISSSDFNYGKWRCFSSGMVLFYVSFCVFAAFYKYTLIVWFTIIPAIVHFMHIFFWRKRIQHT